MKRLLLFLLCVAFTEPCEGCGDNIVIDAPPPRDAQALYFDAPADAAIDAPTDAPPDAPGDACHRHHRDGGDDD